MAGNPTQDMADLSRVMRTFIDSQSQSIKEVHRAHKATQAVNDALEVYESTLGNTNKLSNKQNELYRKTVDAKLKELQAYQRLVKQQQLLTKINEEVQLAGTAVTQDLIDKQKQHATLLTAISAKHKLAEESSNIAHDKYIKSTEGVRGALGKFDHALGGSNGALNLFKGGLGGAIGKMGAFGIVLGWLTEAALKYFETTKKVMIANAGVIEGADAFGAIVNQIQTGFKMGIKPEEFAKMSTESRQTINALNGLNNSLVLSNNIANDFYVATGNVSEAQRQAYLTMTQFMHQGIIPTTKGLQKYSNDLTTQHMINGMSLEQSRALFDGVANEINSLTVLKASRKGERQAILDNQRALIQNNEALGMTAEQASAAAKMLNKMVAAKPLERIKQAAKIRAYGAAMGLGPEADAAAAELMKPKGKQNQAIISAFATAATNIQDTLEQQGIGAALTGTAIMDKLGLEQLFGADSPFSTTLAETMAKPLGELKDTYADFRNTEFAMLQQQAEILKNQAEMIKDGTIVMNGIVGLTIENKGIISKSMDYIGETFKSLAAIPDYFPAFFERMGDNLVNAIKLPFRSFDFAVQEIIVGTAKLFEKIAGVFGFSTLVDIFKQSEAVHEAKAREDYKKIQKSFPGGEPTITYGPNTKPVLKPEQTVDKEKEKVAKEANIVAAENSTKLVEATKKQHVTFTDQLAKLDDSAKSLQEIAGNSRTLIDLAEKQLAALTMSEEQKRKYATSLISSSSKFAAEYTTLG